MASGTFYDSWGPTNTATDSSNRYHQNHLKVTWSSDSTKATYTINAYARSGNGSGYYYMSDYGVTVTLYYSLNGGSWISLGSASGTLNYNNNVANITKTVTINRTHSSQTIKFAADSTGNYLYKTSTQTGNDTINALASYTVSYNANGGTSTPANQTKWYGETLTLTSSTPSRASSTQDGYIVTFNSNGAGYANTSVTAKNTITYGLKTGTNRWNTNSTGTGTGYASGGSYTSNAALTLYAQWTQTSSLGSVNIPNEMKKRDGYTFQGWGTTTAETSIVATAGATTYQPDGNKTLYAIWKQNYVPVALTNIKAIRVATTTSTTTADTGPVGYITVNWTKGDLNGTKFNASKIIYSYNKTGETPSTVTITPSESATTTSFWINNLSIDNSWNIAVTAIDSHDNSQSSKVTLLSPAFFTMDFLKGGKGIAFGKPATSSNIFDCALTPRFTPTSTTTPGQVYIKANPGTRDGSMIRIIDGDANGSAMLIGDGGLTILGGGEYAANRWSQNDLSATSEDLLLGSDSNMYFEVNANTISNRHTMTYSKTNQLIINSDNITNGTAPSSNTNGNGMYCIADKNGAGLGFINPYFTTNGNQYVRIQAYRTIGSNNHTNTLLLGLNNTGNPVISFDNDTNKNAWLQALGLGSVYHQNFGDYVNLYCWGHIAILTVTKSVVLNGNWATANICTIPAGYRPTVTDLYAAANLQPTNYGNVTLYISTNGVVQAKVRGGTSPGADSYFVNGTLIWAY